MPRSKHHSKKMSDKQWRKRSHIKRDYNRDYDADSNFINISKMVNKINNNKKESNNG